MSEVEAKELRELIKKHLPSRQFDMKKTKNDLAITVYIHCNGERDIYRTRIEALLATYDGVRCAIRIKDAETAA